MNSNGYYGQVKAGSQRDMFIAYVIRGVMIVVLCAVLKTGIEIRDSVLRYNDSIPIIQRDLKDMKADMGNFATKNEMNAAEQRIRVELSEQLRKRPAITDTTQIPK